MNNDSRAWKDDRFLLRIVSGILSNFLPFLSTGLCSHCSHTLSNRVKSLDPDVANDLSLMVPAVSPRAQEDEVHESIDGDSQSGQGKVKVQQKPELSTDQREYICFSNVQRKKDFICLERVNGKNVNILDGLELHTCVFNAIEQKRIVDFVYTLQETGMKGEFKERTYTAPEKWMRGKGRVTLQFGCCYNYAKDKNGNPPGILQNEIVDPIPDLFKEMIRRLVRWHVLPPSCVPDSCIVNIYDEGDCIPPHIDSHDFVRPFCTVSFLSECNILFGSSLKVEGPGEFSGSKAIPLPVGSVLVLNGNGADVAKHCVPAVPMKRISITFRKIDESKRPLEFILEPDLEGLQLLSYEPERSKGNPTRHRTTGCVGEVLFETSTSYYTGSNALVEYCLRDKEAHQDTSSQGLVVGTKTRPQSSKVPSFANSRGIAENGCAYCHNKGHWKKECPLMRIANSRGIAENECAYCRNKGHWKKECPLRQQRSWEKGMSSEA